MMKPVILCVANWDSNVGYAWWLMESFWIRIAGQYSSQYDVILVYPSISKVPIAIKKSKLKVLMFDFTFNKSRSCIDQLKFIREHNIKHIYFTDRPHSNWRYILYRIIGIDKIIVHEHTPGEREKPSKLKSLMKKIFNNIPLYRVDGSIGATEYVRRRLIDVTCLPKTRCFTAPNGLPRIKGKQTVSDNIYERFNIPVNRQIIVSVGRANLYKGIDFALETIKLLIEFKCSNVHFLYLGGGPDLLEIQEYAERLGISDFVCFPGRVKDVDVILRSCHIAYHPSKGEVGYSLSILEYMRAGLPVVVPDNPSVCEATTNLVDGMVYKRDDLNAAVKALQLLVLHSPLALSMGKAGIEKVEKLYSLRHCHQSLISSLNFIMGE